MSDIHHSDHNNAEFDSEGNRPNDFVDGIAITTVIFLLVTGMVYYLINH